MLLTILIILHRINLNNLNKLNFKKKYIMKKQILSIIFILSLSFSSSQLISYEAIWVNDGMEEDYLSVEELWSEVKKQAIADDIQDFWVVFKVEKDSTNPESMKKPDYIVFNGFKDDEQRKKQTNWKELAMKGMTPSMVDMATTVSMVSMAMTCLSAVTAMTGCLALTVPILLRGGAVMITFAVVMIRTPFMAVMAMTPLWPHLWIPYMAVPVPTPSICKVPRSVFMALLQSFTIILLMILILNNLHEYVRRKPR